MTEQVGTLLWQMRSASGLSLGKLARQPAITELEAVLKALGANAAQRTQAFARIQAPRAVRHLREHILGDGLLPPPTVGDLLRVMRLRRGWTQEQVAVHLGIHRSSVVRWEQGERLPSAEQTQALCYVLDAHEAELIALTRGHFHETPRMEPTTWEEKQADLLNRLDAMGSQNVTGLEPLHYLMLEREAWEWAVREPMARRVLVQICVHHAHFHRLEQEWEASRPLIEKAIRLASQDVQDPAFLLRAIILSATVEVYGGNRPTPARGVMLLKDRAGDNATPPDFAAWMLADIAEYLVLMGEAETGLALAEKACRLAASCHTGELYMRRMDYGNLLILAGRPAEAQRVLPCPGETLNSERAKAQLLLAEASALQGNLSESHDWLQGLFTTLDVAPDRHLAHLRPRIEALAQRF
jgi:transcriptional regulator with XRE-family HTH domain